MQYHCMISEPTIFLFHNIVRNTLKQKKKFFFTESDGCPLTKPTPDLNSGKKVQQNKNFKKYVLHIISKNIFHWWQIWYKDILKPFWSPLKVHLQVFCKKVFRAKEVKINIQWYPNFIYFIVLHKMNKNTIADKPCIGQQTNKME